MIIGIDLGTTHSEVACVEQGIPRILSDRGQKLLPSVVGLDEQGSVLVGQAAKNQALLFPERTIQSVKRLMGSDQPVTLGDQTFSPQEISALILKRLKTIAEQASGQIIEQAVVTVPAHFSEAARQATYQAGEIAGLSIVRMINEPTAAALAYGLDKKTAATVLVYDLGGGTFDVSIVRIENGVTEVLANNGNTQLGGDDFDRQIVEFLLDHLRQQFNVDVSHNPQVMARLLRAAEQAKIQLSDFPFARIEAEYLLQHDGLPVNLSVELSRAEFEAMIAPAIQETMAWVQDSLKQARLKAEAIDDILLVGGSSRIPCIRHYLFDVFGIEARADVDPELCVAQGAAIQAALIEGQAIDTLLIDVAPYSYGCSVIGSLDGQFYPFQYVPIIAKNTPLPVSKSEAFETSYDNQAFVDIAIYQGESRDALENIKIGEFRVEGLTPAPAGSIIIVTLSLDLNGLLTVTAVEKATGLEKSVTIEQALARLEPEKIEQAQQKITALFGHLENGSRFQPVEPEFRPEQIPEIIGAEQVVQQAEMLYPGLSDAERAALQKLVDACKMQIAQQDIAGLEHSTALLKEKLLQPDVTQ